MHEIRYISPVDYTRTRLLILPFYAAYVFCSEEVPPRPDHPRPDRDKRSVGETLQPRGKGKAGGAGVWAVPAPVSGEPAGGGGGGGGGDGDGSARGAANQMETRKDVERRVAFLERLAEECDAEVIVAG